MARAVVKDSNDTDDLLFLDSDGVINNQRLLGDLAGPNPGATNVSDGYWHMITLTTLPEGGKGYQLYVDGMLAGEVPTAGYNGERAPSRSL